MTLENVLRGPNFYCRMNEAVRMPKNGTPPDEPINRSYGGGDQSRQCRNAKVDRRRPGPNKLLRCNPNDCNSKSNRDGYVHWKYRKEYNPTPAL